MLCATSRVGFVIRLMHFATDSEPAKRQSCSPLFIPHFGFPKNCMNVIGSRSSVVFAFSGAGAAGEAAPDSRSNAGRTGEMVTADLPPIRIAVRKPQKHLAPTKTGEGT